MERHKENIHFRTYVEDDFEYIHQFNIQEEWNNLVAKKEDTKNAWSNSNVVFVACKDDQVIGCLRGITDGYITLFVCEIIIERSHRGLGIGTDLLKFVHSQFPKTRMELLTTSSSSDYYDKQKFRSFYGFRKTLEEWSL